jgi:hypothetical protein
MPETPVVLLVFANEQEGRAYLRDLPGEARQLREVLQAAVERGLCELEFRTNATLDEIAQVFRRYRRRIRIFHYGGHAGPDRLWLESSAGGPQAAHSEGLARFLGLQGGLKLVFLNGCSTRAQVAELRAGGVDAVVATARPIGDEVARAFAVAFYDELVAGRDLSEAFKLAAALVQVGRGNTPRDVISPKATLALDDITDPSGFPWSLYTRDGAEAVNLVTLLHQSSVTPSMGAFPPPNQSWAARAAPVGNEPRFIRFARLNGPGEESIDLHTCLRLIVGTRVAPNEIGLDPTTVTAYYLTPDHRGIMGLGGLRQLQHGGEGYVEVHPFRIAHALNLVGFDLPLELERYRDYLHLAPHDAIAAWEESQRKHSKAAASPTASGHRFPTQDDITNRGLQDQAVEKKDVIRHQVFISYSHRDKRFVDDLQKHLKPYLRKGTITAWSDEQIEPGSQWFDEIKVALAKTSVAVMLVSPDFLNSEFIHEHELSPLLMEAAAGGVTILWVLIRDCSYEETLVAPYQAVVSPPDKPFALMTRAKRDTAWKTVCKAIKEAVSRP